MIVEIWSDVVCPFCYIGKKRFEKALTELNYQGKIEIIWKCFLLNPHLENSSGKTLEQYLCDTKGWSLAQTRQINTQVAEMGKEDGITFHFDKAVLANSINAHRLIHLGGKYGCRTEIKEALFKAYFTDGLDISNPTVLEAIGAAFNISKQDLEQLFTTDLYTKEVEQNYQEALELQIRGVPFFVINRKYGISGAQPVATFTNALKQAIAEQKD